MEVNSGERAAEVQADRMQNQVHWCRPFELYVAAAQVAKRGKNRPWRVPATRPDPDFFFLPEPDPEIFSEFQGSG